MSFADDVTLAGKGSGGLAEMKAQLSSNQVLFGVLRVRAVDDHGSKRAKFVFVTFVGEGVVSVFEGIFFENMFIDSRSHHYDALVFRL